MNLKRIEKPYGMRFIKELFDLYNDKAPDELLSFPDLVNRAMLEYAQRRGWLPGEQSPTTPIAEKRKATLIKKQHQPSPELTKALNILLPVEDTVIQPIPKPKASRGPVPSTATRPQHEYFSEDDF